jgi:hypothetical protein
MGDAEFAQIAVKAIRYVPFFVCGVLAVLSRTLLAERNLRAAILSGSAAGLGLVGWLARYFLEQTSPEPAYHVEPTAAAILSIALPSLAYDLAWAGGLVVAFLAVVRALPAASQK